MSEPKFPDPDDSFARLHRAGWWVREVACVGTAGGPPVWVVWGHHDATRIAAASFARAETWAMAWAQAAASRPPQSDG